MKREELKNHVKNLLDNLQDISKVTEILNTIQEQNDLTETSKETLESDKAKLEQDNEQLRQVNMKFFLKLSNQKKTDNPEENQEGGSNSDPEENKLTFESLFDEKGELL